MPQPKDAGSGDKGGMRIDSKLVQELAALLADNELTEIEVADGDRRIKVKRETPAMIAAAGMTHGFATPAAPSLTAPPMHGKEDIGSDAAVEEVAGTTVKSPMVGTA